MPAAVFEWKAMLAAGLNLLSWRELTAVDRAQQIAFYRYDQMHQSYVQSLFREKADTDRKKKDEVARRNEMLGGGTKWVAGQGADWDRMRGVSPV
jgi:hypothetical protein